VGSPVTLPCASTTIYTDASETGWGAHREDWVELSGKWSPAEIRLHINALEMLAVILAVTAWSEDLRGSSVMIATDNTTVVAHIRNVGGTKSPIMMLLSQQLYRRCMEHQIELSVRHIPGRLNVIADSLSREGRVVSTEWTMNKSVVLAILTRWGQDHSEAVDLFATRYSARLSRFVSPVPDPTALAVDALSIKWNHLSIYAFPPTALLPRVLSKVREEEVTIMLIAPLYRKAIWLPHLLELCIESPIRLPDMRGLLFQPRSGVELLNPRDVLDLHAWNISGMPMRTEAFLGRQPFAPREAFESLQTRFTSQDGFSTTVGVVRGRLISSSRLERMWEIS
jgi:hypothetical protein